MIVILFASGSSTVVGKKQILCKSDDLEIFYSSCDPTTHNFSFQIKPCSLKFKTDRSKWKGFFFWIPKADLTTVFGNVTMWFGNTKVLEWTDNICSGMDDGFSFCGALKGETINTTMNISSGPVNQYPTGEYTALFTAFSSPRKEKQIFCMNYTLIKKK